MSVSSSIDSVSKLGRFPFNSSPDFHIITSDIFTDADVVAAVAHRALAQEA